VIGS